MSHDYETDDEIKKFLEGIVGAVEASSFEELCIWQEYTQELNYSWKQNCSGYLEYVGLFHSRPICINLRTSVVNGHKILFWEATSQLVDYKMIDKWMEKNLPKSARHSDGRLNKTDAMNFCNILPRDVP